METTLINVGDKIVHTTVFGTHTYVVHRVTRTRAYVRYNDVAEGCFRREVSAVWGVQPMPRIEWDTSKWTHIKNTGEQHGKNKARRIG